MSIVYYTILYDFTGEIKRDSEMSMQKPSQVYPNSPMSSDTFMPQFLQDPSLKGLSFDQLIQNRGIRFIHRKAIPCPNIKSIDDNSHDPNCAICEGDGMFYYQEKEIFGLFYSNSLEKNLEQQGMWEIGTAVLTFPTEYADGTQADFNMYDQLVVPDFTVRLWELKEYEPAPDNRQYLRYPINNIEFIASVIDGVLKPFVLGVDYTIVDGGIQWVAGKEPGYSNIEERGRVFTVAYFANPVYNVVQHLRELRITQEMVAGQKVAKRLPQQILVKRDFLSNPNESKR